jgi:hypothetical protein
MIALKRAVQIQGFFDFYQDSPSENLRVQYFPSAPPYLFLSPSTTFPPKDILVSILHVNQHSELASGAFEATDLQVRITSSEYTIASSNSKTRL